MDLRQLRYFVAVAEERNFTRAAWRRLHIAQPPLRRQIQHLEAEIGAPLFDRAARPLRLTPVGRLVFEQATQLLGDGACDTGILGMDGDGWGSVGTRIGSTPGCARGT